MSNVEPDRLDYGTLTPRQRLVFNRVERVSFGGLDVPDKLRTPEMAEFLDKLFLHAIDTDPLTQLPTQARIREELELVVQQRQKDKLNGQEVKPCTVIYIDLNSFKSYNDKLGHAVTDLLIASFAEELRKYTRQTQKITDREKRKETTPRDMIARSHRNRGDEFLVVMQGCDRDTAKMRMEQFLEDISAKTFLTPDKKKIIKNITFACGCYELDSKLTEGENFDTPKSAFEKADAAMHRAKERTKQTVGGRACKKEFRPEITKISDLPPTKRMVALHDPNAISLTFPDLAVTNLFRTL